MPATSGATRWPEPWRKPARRIIFAASAIACDLARRALYDDISSAEVDARAGRARAALARLAAGEEALLDDSGQPAPRRDSATRGGAAPSLTPDSLAGL